MSFSIYFLNGIFLFINVVWPGQGHFVFVKKIFLNLRLLPSTIGLF